MSSIEAVFFDVGGTLVEVAPSVGHVYATACERLGARVAAGDIQRAFDAAWVELSARVPAGANRYNLFEGGEREWWERICFHAFEQCGVQPEHRPGVDHLRDVFARPDAWRIYPEVDEVLKTLKGRGIRLGVISNWDSRLPALLDALDLTLYFEAIVYSAAAGCEKPHPAIFAAALQALDVPPDRAAHVGDRYEEDYQGARQAGLRGLLLDRRGEERTVGAADEPDRVADLRQAAGRIVP